MLLARSRTPSRPSSKRGLFNSACAVQYRNSQYKVQLFLTCSTLTVMRKACEVADHSCSAWKTWLQAKTVKLKQLHNSFQLLHDLRSCSRTETHSQRGSLMATLMPALMHVARLGTGRSTDLEDVDKAGSVAGQEMTFDRLHEGKPACHTLNERPSLNHLLCCSPCQTL